jgi:hypothetical protein
MRVYRKIVNKPAIEKSPRRRWIISCVACGLESSSMYSLTRIHGKDRYRCHHTGLLPAKGVRAHHHSIGCCDGDGLL